MRGNFGLRQWRRHQRVAFSILVAVLHQAYAQVERRQGRVRIAGARLTRHDGAIRPIVALTRVDQRQVVIFFELFPGRLRDDAA